MKRKIFLRVSTLAVLGITLPLSYCSSDQESLDEFLSIPSTLSNIFDKDLINEFGKNYLNHSSRIKDKEGLVGKLLENGSQKKFDKDALHRDLFIQIKSDFDNGHVIKLDGWFLSETELRQCALSYLLNRF